MFNFTIRLLAVLLSILITIPHKTECTTSDSIILKEGLVIQLMPRESGNVISPDKVTAMIESGEWKPPSENEQIIYNGELIGTWKRITADENGWFRDSSLRNAYMYFRYQPGDMQDKLVLLEAMGNSMAYVNGAPRSGNPYANKDEYEDWETRFDYSLLPVRLNGTENHLLFRCHRGVLKIILHTVEQGIILNDKDVTLPDIHTGKKTDTYGAIPIINTSGESYDELTIKTHMNGSEPAYYPVKRINPYSIYKTPFSISFPPVHDTGNIELQIELVDTRNPANVLSSAIVELNVVEEYEHYKATFVSRMDGSVQYYGVRPPVNLRSKPALFLTLHGAGVEAINQVNAYGSKNWGYLVAPTNRRPYGYGWENWGRLDAFEVLDIAMNEFEIDEERVYLTGHSMGGYGTWHIGVNYPDRFAALGPSAGRESIWGYRITPEMFPGGVGRMLIRSTRQSDTYALAANLKQTGIYVIHGEADEIVTVEHSRAMVEFLSTFHLNYIYHEEPGEGHWWNISDEAGEDCVDWMPMFDYFARHSVPGKERVKMIEFVTANPAVSSKNNWIEIINQIEQQKISKIDVHLESNNRKFFGTTDNIEMLAIDVSMLPDNEPISVDLDDQLISGIPYPNKAEGDGKRIYLRKENDTWAVSGRFKKENKYPGRLGNFREVLNHNVVFVYATRGNEEENKWAYDKARYDAERTWYQGNGAIEVIPDTEFDAEKFKDRNVVLFGNLNTNSAWNDLLADSPVQVMKGKIIAGDDIFEGDDLASLFILSRKDSDIASVGVIAGTNIKGMRLANFAPYDDSIISLPDIVVYDSGIVESDERGVRFTGYFGNDWSLERGEFIRQ
jgi:poly(3-hydroxybutyrate) depolymerase